MLKKEKDMDRYNKFNSLLAQINRSINRIKNREASKLGIKSFAISTIYILFVYGQICAKDIVKISGEDKSIISKALNYLKKIEFIEHNVAQEKKYGALISLTDSGRLIGSKILNKINQTIAKAGSDFNDDSRESFYNSLELISDNLEKLVNI